MNNKKIKILNLALGSFLFGSFPGAITPIMATVDILNLPAWQIPNLTPDQLQALTTAQL
jgi:hypothetical protein